MAKQSDPWVEPTEEEIAEEALKNRDLHIQLGLIFQNAKEETYAQWCAWDEALVAPEETNRQEARGEEG